MSKEHSRIDLINNILADAELDLLDEELIHLLLQERLAEDVHSTHQKKLSLGERAADAVARFAGSWTFIGTFFAALLVWIVINAIMLAHPYDPYPFILLNLILSCVAAMQAPVIMMSQNRQEQKDRLRAENDYRVNVKSEIIIADLHKKLDQLLANQEQLTRRLEQRE